MAPASFASFAVLSVEPSSQTTTSSTCCNDFFTISCMLDSSLYAGMQASFNFTNFILMPACKMFVLLDKNPNLATFLANEVLLGYLDLTKN